MTKKSLWTALKSKATITNVRKFTEYHSRVFLDCGGSMDLYFNKKDQLTNSCNYKGKAQEIMEEIAWENITPDPDEM